METTAFTIVLVSAIALLLAVTAILFLRRARTGPGHLREHYGPELDLLTNRLGSDRAARHELKRRERRVRRYHIRKLHAEERDGFHDEWLEVQRVFVDDPTAAVEQAESLLHRVMDARGYPVRDFDHNAADLSVDHPRFVDAYREAHGIALATREQRATTEDLRRAVVLYREMFEDLLAR